MPSLDSFIITNDGSFSMVKHVETMHNVHGALGESLYVYEPVVEYVLKYKLVPTFLVVGLGLGYIKILLCAYVLKFYPEKLSKLNIVSYEQDEYLRASFQNFFLKLEVPDILRACYTDIIVKIAHNYGLSNTALIDAVQKLILEQRFLLNGSIGYDTRLPWQVSGICFDAYSAKTNPQLWQDDFLQALLHQCHQNCCFATYAALGSLKRLLRSHNFKLVSRRGFTNKRECTFAVR